MAGLAELVGVGGGRVGRGCPAPDSTLELLLEGVDGVAEAVGHGAALDLVEQRAVAAAHELEQLGLEALDVGDGHVVEVAAGCRRR